MGFDGYEADGWRSQWRRVNRWFDRLEEISKNRATHGSPEEWDIAYAFFQNAVFLKDWLVNSRAIEARTVEIFFDVHWELRLCQDVSNGTKHFKLRNPRSKILAMVPREYEDPGLERDPDQMVWLLGLFDENRGFGTIDVFQLAKRCMDTWRLFLDSHGLDPEEPTVV